MNVLKPDKKSTIITLLKNGVGQREVHRMTNIDRKTIRKYAKESGLLSEDSDLRRLDKNNHPIIDVSENAHTGLISTKYLSSFG